MSVPCEHESHRNVIESFAMAHHIQSYQDSNANPKFMMQALKMQCDSVRRSQANETSRHIRTRHMRHIDTPDDQTNQKLFISHKQRIVS